MVVLDGNFALGCELRTDYRKIHIFQIWSNFDRASSLICGNKMPTGCKRCFYCRSYCLLNIFQAQLCPSSGAREYHTVGCCLWYLVTQPSAAHYTDNLKTKAPNTTGSNQLYGTLELLVMGIMVPETCWASNKICNKKTSVASSWHFISTYISIYARTNRCYNERGSRTNYVRSSIPHYIYIRQKPKSN